MVGFWGAAGSTCGPWPNVSGHENDLPSGRSESAHGERASCALRNEYQDVEIGRADTHSGSSLTRTAAEDKGRPVGRRRSVPVGRGVGGRKPGDGRRSGHRAVSRRTVPLASDPGRSWLHRTAPGFQPRCTPPGPLGFVRHLGAVDPAPITPASPALGGGGGGHIGRRPHGPPDADGRQSERCRHARRAIRAAEPSNRRMARRDRLPLPAQGHVGEVGHRLRRSKEHPALGARPGLVCGRGHQFGLLHCHAPNPRGAHTADGSGVGGGTSTRARPAGSGWTGLRIQFVQELFNRTVTSQ